MDDMTVRVYPRIVAALVNTKSVHVVNVRVEASSMIRGFAFTEIE